MSVIVSTKGVLRDGNSVLFLRNPRNEWELPGGRPEDGESLEQALVREVREECGLVLEAVHYIGSRACEIVPTKWVLIVCFECEWHKDRLSLSAEHYGASWISLEEPRPADVPDFYWGFCLASQRCRVSSLREELASTKSDVQVYPLQVGERDARRLHLTNLIYNPSTLEFLRRHIPRGGRILEVGCGHGQIASWLSKNGDGAEVVAVDRDPTQIEFARQLCARDGANVDFHVVDLGALGDPSPYTGAFDLVFCRFTLLHYAALEQGLRNLLACLSTGGVLVLEEPSLSSLFSIPPMPAFYAANHAILAYGTKTGVSYDCADQIWTLAQEMKVLVREVRFVQPTIWLNEHKELVLMSFIQFRRALVEAEILSNREAEQIETSLREEVMSDKVVTGGLRNIQLALSC